MTTTPTTHTNTATAVPAEDAAPHVDFDLHGFVGVRLLDPRPSDVAMVTRQIGPLTAALSRAPDITVRFVDQLPEPGPLTFAGWPDCGGSDDAFYLLRGKDGVPARTLLPLDAVADGAVVVCERRAGHVPHLLALINLSALRHGVLPLHASAFVHRGVGVLATGWGKGGKTETLLALAATRGAQYVGDEWVYLTPEGGMHGVPEPIRLWSWQLQQLPAVRATLPRATRARLRALPVAASTAAGLAGRLRGLPASVLRRAAPVVRRQANVQLPPAQIFGAEAVVLHGRLDHVLFVTSADRDEITVAPVPGAEVAARMLASLEEERGPLLQVYRQFRFLFPDRRVPMIEEAAQTERRLLDRYLADRPASVLRHPYPVDLASLVEPVESAVGGRP